MEKYKIEKDSVQETLIIPLYGRRLCSRRFPGLYQDTTAAMLMEKVDYDFSPLERQANGLMQTLYFSIGPPQKERYSMFDYS